MKNKPCDFCEKNCEQEHCRTNKEVEVFNPPSGWKYGFPREVPEGLDTDGKFKEWLIKCGYPEKDLDLALRFGRRWYK